MTKQTVYLDYNASTPCDPIVVEAMLPYFHDVFANPASRNHQPGQKAFIALEDARRRIGHTLGARTATQIIFTGGATEGNNLVIKGVAEHLTQRGRHLITQATEHPSVLEPMKYLETRGWEVTVIGVDHDGTIRLEELAAALRPDTALVSLMLANNETGTIQPVAEAAAVAHDAGALLHCDGAQGPGKLAVNLADLGVDYLTLSAHKVYGPKGVGAVCQGHGVRLRFPTILHGGGQEDGFRSGTSNVPAIVGFATAMELSSDRRAQDASQLCNLRDRLERRITRRLDGCTVNGATDQRLPGTSNISFAGIEGNALLASLPDLAISSGSACSSARVEASYVLRAMGVKSNLAAASIRFSLGRATNSDEIDRAADRVVEEVTRLRQMSRRRRR